MKNSAKRILSFALVIIMCVSLLPVYALADEIGTDTQIENIETQAEPLSDENAANEPEQEEASQPEKADYEYASEEELSLNYDGPSQTDSICFSSTTFDVTNKSASIYVDVSISTDTAQGGCSIVYYYGLNSGIVFSDPSTYLQRWQAEDVYEAIDAENKKLEIPELIPEVKYYIIVAVEKSGQIIAQTLEGSITTSSGDNGFEEINVGSSFTLDGKENNAFVFEPEESGLFGFSMFGGECGTNAYRTDGSIIECYVKEDRDDQGYCFGHTRFVEVNQGEKIYFYATGSEEGEENYSLAVNVYSSADVLEISGTVDADNKSVRFPITYSVKPQTAYEGCCIEYFYGLNGNIDPYNEESYLGKWTEREIWEPVLNEETTLEMPELIPDTTYYFVIALVRYDNDGMHILSQDETSFTTKKGDEGFDLLTDESFKRLDGRVNYAFKFVALESAVYIFDMVGGDCGTNAYNKDGSIIKCRTEYYEGGHARFVPADAGEPIYFYATGFEEGDNRYELKVSKDDASYDEQKLREEIDKIKEHGGNIELQNSITLSSDIVIPSGIFLNLNGGTFTVPKGKKLTLSRNSGINVQDGNLAVNGTLINNGSIGKYSAGNITIASYSGNGEVYEQVDSSGFIKGIKKSQIIAQKYVNSIDEIDDFSISSSAYLRVVADAGEIEITESYELPENCSLNIVPQWVDGWEKTGELRILEDAELYIGSSSELAASADARIEIHGDVVSDGTTRTDRNEGEGKTGRIVICDGGHLESSGCTRNYGIIEVLSGSKLDINENDYEAYYDYRCVEVRDAGAELNGLSEDKCVLILEADDMAELKSCLSTNGWSCVSIMLGLSSIDENITVGQGMTLAVPTYWDDEGAQPSTVTVENGVNLIIAPDAQLGIEESSKLINNGTISVFGGVSDFGQSTAIENNGTIEVFGDGWISENISITGNEIIRDTGLKLGSNVVYSNRGIYCFTAPEESENRWYSFKVSGEQLSRFGYSKNPDDGSSWNWLWETDMASIDLEPGESVWFNLNSWSGNAEQLTIDVSNPSKADEYAINTGDLIVAGNDFAEVEITFSASGDDEYEYGVFYAPYFNDFEGGEDWFSTYCQKSAISCSAPASEQTVAMKSMQAIPDTRYMYQAFIAVGTIEEGQEDSRTFYFGDLKDFTTLAMDKGLDKFTKLKSGETITPTGYAYYFDIPTDSEDMYVFALKGYDANIQVYNGYGYSQNQFWFENVNDMHAVAVRKPSFAGDERLYIYVSSNGNEECSLSVETEEPEAELKNGSNTHLDTYSLYTYIAPEAGRYRFSTWDGCTIWGYKQLEGGWQNCGNEFEIDAEKNEAIYVLLERGNDINVRRYDNDGRRIVKSAEELIEFFNGNDKACIVDDDIALPLPAGQSEYFYYTDKNIIISDGNTLSVPNMVVLHSDGNIEVSEGGELRIGRGGRFESNGYVQVNGTITVEKTGELQSSGFIHMLGGKLSGNGDCYIEGNIGVDCSLYDDPREAIPGIDDYSHVGFYKMVISAAEAEAFIEKGKENSFEATPYFKDDVELEKDLIVPYSCSIGISEGATLSIPEGKTLSVARVLYLESGSKIINNGTLIAYNSVECTGETNTEIVNNGTVNVTTNVDYKGDLSGEGNLNVIQVSGIAVAAFEDLIECTKSESGTISIVGDINVPEGSYVQNGNLEITNGAEVVFSDNAKLESSSSIVLADGTLDITANGAEIEKIDRPVVIRGENAYFWTKDKTTEEFNFNTGADKLGVMYCLDGESLSEHTDLPQSKVSLYRGEAHNFSELTDKISNSEGWKYVYIDCVDEEETDGIELTSENCTEDNPLVINDNVVLGIYEYEDENQDQVANHLNILPGAYVENNGIFDISGSGDEALLVIKKESHFSNNGQIIFSDAGLVYGLENIVDGIVIDDCVFANDADGAYWSYVGKEGENCVFAKTTFTANKKLTWSMDNEYTQYATFDVKKATLTPRKITQATEIELTATDGTHTARVKVLLKPTATKISIFSNGENYSGKSVNVNVDNNCIPFYISTLPVSAYYDLTVTDKNNDFHIVETENYILLQSNILLEAGKTGVDAVAAVLDLYGDDSGTLWLLNPKLCAKKSFTLTAASGKVKTSTMVSFVQSGEGIVFDGELAEEIVDVTGGDKLSLEAHFNKNSSSDSIAWEFDDGESSSFASLKTTKGVTTLTTNKVTANTTIRICAYSVNNPWGCRETKEIVLHPAATSAQMYRRIDNDGDVYYEPIADKSKLFVTTETDTYNLSGSLMPCGDSSAIWSTVEFTSKDSKVVEINQDGENASLTFKKAGVSAVTLTYKNEAGKTIKSSTVTFTVRVPFDIILTTSSDTVYAGGSATITAISKPANNKLVWSLRDDYLNDWVTLKASGTKCTVNVKAGCDWKEDDGRVYIIAQSAETDEICAEIPITVKPKEASALLYTYGWNEYGQYDINVTGQTCQMNTGEEMCIEKICLVEDNEVKNPMIEKGSNMWNSLVWKSSAPKTATVDEYGLVTAKAKGTSKITVSYTYANGTTISGEFTVRVGTRIDNIEIRPANNMPIVSGKTAVFTAYDGTGKKVNAVFSLVYGSEYASVTATGTVKAAAGLANRAGILIKAVLKDNPNIEAYYSTEVVPAATNVIIWTKLNGGDGQKSDGKTFNVAIKPNGKAYVHDSVQLQIGQYPNESYYDPQFTLPKGVTIDREGYLTFAKPGAYTIKVTAGDGSGKSSQVKFNVQRAVETIEAEDTEVIHGKSVSLKAVLNGGAKADAPKNTKVTWSLLYPSDEAYCTLTAAGKFTANANAAGKKVKVVVTAQDNGLRDIITVTIK